jgi:hypothetical protein
MAYVIGSWLLLAARTGPAGVSGQCRAVLKMDREPTWKMLFT